MNFTTTSAAQTLALGKRLAKTLKSADVVALSGPLGAGKTTLVKGIAAGLGIKKTVTSPTFLLMRVYPLPKMKNGITRLVHIDCYRITRPSEIEAIGAIEYFGQSGTLVLVEWPEKIKKLLPKASSIYTIEQLGITTNRKITNRYA